MIGRGSDGSTGPRFPNGVFAVREADGSVALFEAGLRVAEAVRNSERYERLPGEKLELDAAESWGEVWRRAVAFVEISGP